MRKNIFYIVLEWVCVIIFLYAAYQLWEIYQDYQLAAKEYERLAEHVVVEQSMPELSESVAANKADESSDYHMPSYEVDLSALKSQNEDLVGWIILPDSKINYPIVKSADNTEYLTTTFEGQTANSGAIFMDMYCAMDFSSENTIIYGHNMKNGSMFRALNNLTDREYFENHRIFCINTGNGFENYEIISCYETIETDLSSWQISFESKNAYEKWLQEIVKRCSYDCQDYDINRNTITLSTCRGQTGGQERFIVHLQKMD